MKTFSLCNKIFDYFFIMCGNKNILNVSQTKYKTGVLFHNINTLLFVIDNISIFYTAVNFELNFIEPKGQGMS